MTTSISTDRVYPIAGDAKYTWRMKLGQVSHAVEVGRKRTLCGLKVGRDWLTGSKKVNAVYRAKCETCKALAR